MNVYLYLADGFEEIEAISVVDILPQSRDPSPNGVYYGEKEVVGAHHITVMADILFEDVDDTDVDMMILPGGGQGTQNLAEHVGLTAQIAKQAMDGKWIAAICAAPTILGKLGLLAGKSATCYPGCEPQLTGAHVRTSPSVIVDGKIITSRGPGTSCEFGLKIVGVLKGIELGNNLKKQMVIA